MITQNTQTPEPSEDLQFYKSLVGRPVQEVQAMLEKLNLNYRLLDPDSVYSQDYQPERLNLYEHEGRVTSIKLG